MGQETGQHLRDSDSDAPGVQQGQIPQEEVYGSVEFGLHKDGCQYAGCGQVGQEEDGKKDRLQSYVLCHAKQDELSDNCPIPPGTWLYRLLIAVEGGKDFNLPKGDRGT